MLGRCHQALGQHMLSAAALDSGMQVATAAELLFSEAMVVRERALLGRAAAAGNASNGGPHWAKDVGKQRLSEMMGRMAGDKQLLEKLLLHGMD